MSTQPKNHLPNALGEPGSGAFTANTRAIWIVAAAAVTVAVVLALALALAPTSTDTGFELTPVSSTGEGLAPFREAQPDTALGQRAPELAGTDPAGRPIQIARDGRPKVIGFLAHWCPHCQAEVPDVQAYLDEEGAPEGVDLYSVLTLSDRAKGNWPPDRWLEDEGWTTPVLVDDADDTAALSFGLAGTPFWVAVDAAGNVVARRSGQIGAAGIQQLIDTARNGSEAQSDG